MFRRRLAIVALGALGGCGRLGFDAQPRDAIEPSRCSTWSAFGGPLELTDVSIATYDDWTPHITQDDLSLYFDQWNGADFDVAVSTRATPDDTFTSGVRIADLATGSSDQAAQPGLTTGGMYVMRVGSDKRLFHYDTDGQGRFGNPQELVELRGLQHYWISADELRVYWILDQGVHLSSRTSLGDAFGSTIRRVDLGPIVSSDESLALSADERELFVGSARIDGRGGHDLYRLVRPEPDGPFIGGFEPLDAVNTAFDEVVGSLSADGTTLYTNLATDLSGARDAQIWVTTRTCLD